MASRSDLIIEKAREQKKLDNACMDFNNAQADLKQTLNPTTIEEPTDEEMNEASAAWRRLTQTYSIITASRTRIAAIEKELNA